MPVALGTGALFLDGYAQSGLVFQVGFRHEDLVLLDIGAQGLHQVLALVLNGGEPAEMIISSSFRRLGSARVTRRRVMQFSRAVMLALPPRPLIRFIAISSSVPLSEGLAYVIKA